MRNLKGGYKIKYRGYIEQFFGFRGVSKAGKACEKPAKGGFRNCVSPEIGGCFQREGTSICVMRTLNNTEWGGGGREYNTDTNITRMVSPKKK